MFVSDSIIYVLLRRNNMSCSLGVSSPTEVRKDRKREREGGGGAEVAKLAEGV